MNEAAAQPSTTPHDPAPADVVLPNLRWALIEAVLAVALGIAFFLIPADWTLLHGATGGATIGSLCGLFVTSTFRYEIRGGRLAATEMHRTRQTVDLTRLASVTAPDRQEPSWSRVLLGRQRWLELRDEQSHVVRLRFYGTTGRRRQRMLAALEPYVMAGGVSRAGLVTEALSGELW
ncbi:MAG TPA: hypothetical protein VGQ05_16030 [Streptosporangiaceae bacterium]|jgi:hypothetical protein|nr:hypothetical protein [Streptosporangiaceae bacterium]